MNPYNGIRAVSICRSVTSRTQWSSWAVVLLLSSAFCVLCILRYDGMKRSGLTLHDIVHETCSTLNMQLYCISGFAGVCLSHYSIDPIYNEHLIVQTSTLWFLFVS